MSRWPALRAVLIALHVAVVFAQAFPAPGGGTHRSTWKDPTVQQEFRVWTGHLNRLGLDLSVAQLEDHLWAFTQRYMGARSLLLDPVRPYSRYLGTYQGWRMFVAPHRYPALLDVQIYENGRWRRVYRTQDVDAEWLGPVFEHDRMRSSVFRYSWRPYRRSYRQLVDWLARQARRDFPEATVLKAHFIKYRTLSPEEVRAGQSIQGEPILRQSRRLR